MTSHQLYKLYEKLEWPLLIAKLASFCQTQEGGERTQAITPSLPPEGIEKRWAQVKPLADFYQQGARIPIGELEPVAPLLKAVQLGQILEGKQLRLVLNLLAAVRKVFAFCQDFAGRCVTLEGFKKELFLITPLFKEIERAVDEEGHLLDTASTDLADIRRQKRQLTRRIEQKIAQLLHQHEWELYLQDDFYTVRADRYVLPIKLDGRGRVPGAIVDTSDSGQTLYIEPVALAPMNQALQDLELSEKLEMLRILKLLSVRVAQEFMPLESNYESLIALDQLSAEAQLACALRADKIRLSERPCLKLIAARHPLVTSPEGKEAVANHIALEDEQFALIISGPNAGGKTVVLKTVGLLLLMVKAGLLVPADPDSEIYPFAQLYVEMGDAQNLTANLSTFSGHIQGLKPIIANASPRDLVLLDELAVGTEPQTGAAIAQGILEYLAKQGCFTLVTTHFDNLKGLAVNQPYFRNASMEYSLQSFKPTYKLILDVPGQSYGLELAEQIGLPRSLIARARELRGIEVSALDEAVAQLMSMREQMARKSQDFEKARDEAEGEKARWQHELSLLEQTRQGVAEKLKAKFEKELGHIKEDYDALAKQLRQAKASERESYQETKLQAKASMEQYQKTLAELSQGHQRPKTLPGKEVGLTELHIGQAVFVVPLHRKATIAKLGSHLHDKVEVQAGLMKLKVHRHELRLLPKEKGASPLASPLRSKDVELGAVATSGKSPLVVVKTATNSLDLRGLAVEQALQSAWRFIDAAVLRGERAIILVHGHGTDALKQAIREALASDSPYALKFQAGDRHLGGDGVTIVYFED